MADDARVEVKTAAETSIHPVIRLWPDSPRAHSPVSAGQETGLPQPGGRWA